MMTQRSTTTTFCVEGPGWKETVSIDTDIFPEESMQLFEAATIAIENNFKLYGQKFKLGPMVQIKEKSGKKRTALVNAYMCLNNAGKPALAERLNRKFKEAEGQDLSIDDAGYSWLE